MLQPEHEQAGLSGDRNADLVVEFEAGESLEVLLRYENLDKLLQAVSLALVEPAVVGDITSQYCFPPVGEGRLE